MKLTNKILLSTAATLISSYALANIPNAPSFNTKGGAQALANSIQTYLNSQLVPAVNRSINASTRKINANSTQISDVSKQATTNQSAIAAMTSDRVINVLPNGTDAVKNGDLLLSAVTKAKTEKTPVVIKVYPGSYNLTQILQIPSNVTLEGISKQRTSLTIHSQIGLEPGSVIQNFQINLASDFGNGYYLITVNNPSSGTTTYIKNISLIGYAKKVMGSDIYINNSTSLNIDGLNDLKSGSTSTVTTNGGLTINSVSINNSELLKAFDYGSKVATTTVKNTSFVMKTCDDIKSTGPVSGLVNLLNVGTYAAGYPGTLTVCN